MLYTMLEIKEFKNKSIITRKTLNESTKQFRSRYMNNNNSNSNNNSNNNSVSSNVSTETYMELLKSYQEEIDR